MRRYNCFLTAFLIMLILSIAIFVIGTTQSYGLALRDAGIYKEGSVTVDSGINNNNDEYRIVAEYTSGENSKIAYLFRNWLGFWRVDRVEELNMSWINVIGINRFQVSDAVNLQYETHLLYCGNNAIKRIEQSGMQLPNNVAVSVYQAGSTYMLHFISYGDADVLNEIDPTILLKNTGYTQ